MRVPPRRFRALLDEYLFPQWRRVLVIGALLLASIGLRLANPQVVRGYIDAAQIGAPVEALLVAGLLYLLIAFATQLTTVVEIYLAEDVGWVATNRLRADLVSHCLRLDPGFHAAHTPGEMIERVDGDVAALANVFARFVTRVLANVLLLVGVVASLVLIDWRVGGAFAVFAAIVFATFYRLRALPVPHAAAARQASGELYGFLEERLAGVEDLRANGAVGHALRGLHRALGSHARVQRRAVSIGMIGPFLFFAYWGVANGMTFGLGATLLPAGVLTLGTVYLIFAYTEMILNPLRLIAEQVQDVQNAGASLARVDDLLGTHSRVIDGRGDRLQSGPLAIEFADVTFAYGEGEPALHGVSFRVEHGRRLGLLGRTGSGKTTITRLLFRFYDPTAGMVRLGDVDVRNVPLADLRARLGMVTQDVQLVGATVRDNLTFFDRAIPDERLVRALEEVGLGGWLRARPGGLDSELEAGGGGLSAGEAQLLAFARVFLRDPDVVVLDEATSRLDAETAQLVERATDRLLRGRTALIVAHRLETVERADEILVLEASRMLEHGPRAALAADPNSRYSRLLRTGFAEVRT